MKTHSPREGKAKEQHVHAVFENIAPKYDVMNDIISFRRHKAWRTFTMKKMNVQRGQTALDLCCGTCDWTIQLAQATETGAVYGLDFSANMLAHGKTKVDKLGLDKQITLVQGNAMELPFEDNTFDYVTIGFGLRNVPDYMQVIREMRRVVKPGGKVVCLETSKPLKQPFKGVYNFYFQKLMPMVGKLVAKRHEQYQWLSESQASFPDHVQLARMFEEAGLERVEVKPFFMGVAALHMGTKGNEHV
ncbi:demethylmenaquinone methyltransferase [Paenibacillus sp. SC116]|uniref:demethylmenaquinone methyltransferase n=1 Tax=Paenibacillus sp. SC116 TaxID=2968986 RepID=UPI00215ADA9C|nr:demethylmenaquinone methyltransferase [Paenibacillus sp. SC116]MCR8842966.1 demethylmenaquinone methyltransferase [Paenibacillus sp. SC116]